MASVRLAPNSVFARDFHVLYPLAEGGMGAVYVVQQLSTSERRALKIMHPDLVSDERNRARFDREARVSGQIASQHAVKVIAAGVDDATGTPFICMELLEGEDLATHLERVGRMDHASAATLFRQIGHALELAHAASIVHRDLKPENIFLSKPLGPGTPFTAKILDFGIAKIVDEVRGTQPTAPIGTPFWMAPEQTDPYARIGPATDVWSFGLIAFRVLTGRPYWRAANVPNAGLSALLSELIAGDLPPASVRANELGVAGTLPLGFDRFFAGCVNRSPDARFRHAGEACAALLACLSGGGASAPAVAMVPATRAAPTTGTLVMSPAPAQPSFDVAGAGAAPSGSGAMGTGMRVALAIVGLGLVAVLCGGSGLAAWALSPDGLGLAAGRDDPPGRGGADGPGASDDAPRAADGVGDEPAGAEPTGIGARCERSRDCEDPLRQRCDPMTRQCVAVVHWADLRVIYTGQPERRLRSTTFSSFTATSAGNWFTYTYGSTFFALIVPPGAQPGELQVGMNRGDAMVQLSDNDIAIPLEVRGSHDVVGTMVVDRIDERPGGVVEGTVRGTLNRRHGRDTGTIEITFHGVFESSSE